MVKIPKPRVSPVNVGRAIGALGSSIPAIGDVGVLAFIKRKSGTPLGIGAKQGLKYAGGPIAVASWAYMGYQNRHLPGQIYGNMQIGYDQWMQRPEMQKVDRTTRTRTMGGRSMRTSRGGRGATTLSQRASKSVRPGKRRRRCKSRNKSGKTCLRPRNHSGRHRFK